jgi:hypothetical protein
MEPASSVCSKAQNIVCGSKNEICTQLVARVEIWRQDGASASGCFLFAMQF